MTWREIAAIHASGLVEFQSHTFESRFVPKWPLEVPLAACDPSIERKRRRPPLSFEADLGAVPTRTRKALAGSKGRSARIPDVSRNTRAVQTARDSAFRACYWGLIPGRPVNRRGDSPFYVSRLSDEFLRRLPGTGRITIREMFRARHYSECARVGRGGRDS